MEAPLTINFNEICAAGLAVAGYTSGLCGEWTLERFEILASELGVKTSQLITANQHHTDKIHVADIKDSGLGVLRPHDDNYFDAVITQSAGLVLCVHTADCVPVVLFDPVKKVIGAVHSGWVGSSKRIAEKTVIKMSEAFGSDPKDIICCIGPYNHSCCYEVGGDVLEKFREHFSDAEREKLFITKENGKYMLDLGLAVSLALCGAGVLSENIHDSGHCTYHTENFSSWRRTRNIKNQIMTYIFRRHAAGIE